MGKNSTDIDWLLREDPFDWIEDELRRKESKQRKRDISRLKDAEKKYLEERKRLRERRIPIDWFERDLEKLRKEGKDPAIIIPPIIFEDKQKKRPKRIFLKNHGWTDAWCDDPGRYEH